MTEQEQMRENVIRLLETKEKPNIDLALQMLSSGVVEWSRCIEETISKATHDLVLRNRFRGLGTQLLFSIDDSVVFFGLSVKLIDQSPKLGYNFLDKHLWQDCSHPMFAIGKPMLISVMGNNDFLGVFPAQQNGYTTFNFDYTEPLI